jgi:hypothetical protein
MMAATTFRLGYVYWHRAEHHRGVWRWLFSFGKLACFGTAMHALLLKCKGDIDWPQAGLSLVAGVGAPYQRNLFASNTFQDWLRKFCTLAQPVS